MEFDEKKMRSKNSQFGEWHGDKHLREWKKV